MSAGLDHSLPGCYARGMDLTATTTRVVEIALGEGEGFDVTERYSTHRRVRITSLRATTVARDGGLAIDAMPYLVGRGVAYRQDGTLGVRVCSLVTLALADLPETVAEAVRQALDPGATA